MAKRVETLEDLVIYKALYEPKEFRKNVLWTRPKKMVEEEVMVDGRKITRFRFTF